MRRILLALVAIMLSFTTLAGVVEATPSQTVKVVTVAAAKQPSKCDTVKPASAHKACWQKEIQRQKDEKLFWTEWRKLQEFKRQDAIWRANLERLAAYLANPPPRTGYGYVDGILVCNGTTLPTCGIVDRESDFNPNIRNSSSTAWGLYQFLRGTWNAVCREFQHGRATVAQQVECARRLWDNGRGSFHWRLTR